MTSRGSSQLAGLAVPVSMLGGPQEIKVEAQWYELVSYNPVDSINPQVFVMPVMGGMLFRVVVPGNPVVFVPNVTVADLKAPSPS